ncbi:hypothetical protein BC940DRAFT_335853 [Gongronella butleri]|nr:hypothetical protein BC940DRAFT_335853 [Gongronella butleri]
MVWLHGHEDYSIMLDITGLPKYKEKTLLAALQAASPDCIGIRRMQLGWFDCDYPGTWVGNSLYPYRRSLKHGALAFADIGLVSHNNVTLEWPESQLARGNRQKTLAKLVDWQADEDDEQDSSTLREVENVAMRHHAPDYKILQEKEVIVVTEFGHGKFRNKQYLCLILDDGRRVRCGNGSETVAGTMLSGGQQF